MTVRGPFPAPPRGPLPEDDAGRAEALGVSREAVELCRSSDVIDLHVDTFIWTRLLGYDLTRRHGTGPFRARLFGHADLPRLVEAGFTGATWVITTNPFRSSRGRARAFFANLGRLTGIFHEARDRVALVRTVAEYRAARAAGKHAAFVGVQGGNALDHDLEDWERIPGSVVTRVTLVHLTSSSLGATSSPLALRDGGLTARGHELVRRLNDQRIFVDLAHASPKTFRDAVRTHDRSLPVLATHTGVSGVHPHWRNLDDEQLRAIADLGGVAGIIQHRPFLGRRRVSADHVAAHLEHVVRTVGEDHAALGSDWDGAITTPRDMPTCLELPRLVECLLRRGLGPDTIRKILGQNVLRVLASLRG